MNNMSFTIEEAVDLAISNIKNEGLTDIFNITFDLNYIEEEVSNHIKAKLKTKDFQNIDLSPIEHILIPKSRTAYDWRRGALMCPLSTIYYLSMAIYTAPKIEAARISRDENILFSYRFEPSENKLFSASSGYNKWLEKHKEKRNNPAVKVIVSSDIAGFYDRVNLHRLKTTLINIGVENWACELIDKMHTYWTKKDSYGLPIGNNGSRIFSEAALIDIDNFLYDENIDFIRFVDDYKMYAPDLITAQKWLSLLTQRLFRNGLMLNSAKTKITANTNNEEDIETDDPATEILKTVIKLEGSKYNKVPKRFKMPKEEKHALFKSVDLNLLENTILTSHIIEFEEIQKFIIASIVQQNFQKLALVHEFIKRCIYGVDYIIDMLKINKNDIPDSIRSTISNNLSDLLFLNFFGTLDWPKTKLIELLSFPEYKNTKVLLHIIRNKTVETTSLPIIKAIEGLFLHATRSEVYTIRDIYDNLDNWSKRRVMYLIAAKLPSEESDAWFRAIRINDLEPISKIIHRKHKKS